MFKKLNANIWVALCTASTLIAFAFYQRHAGSVNLTVVDFYIAAAVICLSPRWYCLVRRKVCLNKTSKVC
jgi:hypothetical protein